MISVREVIVDTQSMRGFLAMVKRDFPDELVRIREPVRRELRYHSDGL